MTSISTIVRVQQAYACPAEAVYDAWLSPDLARQFLFATPPTGEVIDCEIDPAVHGRFVVTDRRHFDDGGGRVDIRHEGRFLQLDRPRRIAFSFWLPHFGNQSSTVIVDIEPQGDGCTLTLRHDLGPWFTDVELRGRTEEGWERMLENLRGVVGG